ncbi:MAG TPA: LuxR family transcriptional regulator [Leptolyngbyaceae cyanobacterium M33_DOE_097]|uniref:LuxR family transcriptional regulator n=1 Tax=Oscillatoriales cyanobacterium SpSt-418 TaxID=2282169 RepID=A0A7C3PN52_9CYAN|nr:LuxR family transcriptional regulator [Leptolyngbyaceae cyanobacterium M33_DOE_097]
METPLQPLFQAIAQAQDETELRGAIMATLGTYFAANRWSLMFLDQLPTVNEKTPKMLRLALSLDHNPVLRYLIQRHTAVHEEIILPPGVWQTICPRADHGHVLLGPIISQGQLVGGIAFTRHHDDPAFNADNLADLSALCLHLSTRLAELRSKPAISELAGSNATASVENRLTPREMQIAELVAQGMTNAQIGAALWITEHTVKQALKRMFRKLEVSSRAELVAKIAKFSNKLAAS